MKMTFTFIFYSDPQHHGELTYEIEILIDIFNKICNSKFKSISICAWLNVFGWCALFSIVIESLGALIHFQIRMCSMFEWKTSRQVYNLKQYCQSESRIIPIKDGMIPCQRNKLKCKYLFYVNVILETSPFSSNLINLPNENLFRPWALNEMRLTWQKCKLNGAIEF